MTDTLSALLRPCFPAIFTNDERWRATLATAAYTARVFLAIGIALFLAFTFQLQSPMSAATTVLIVANPTVGAMVSKSMWRVIGTIIGASISVGVMAAFVQSPVLYYAALAFFVGLACMVATFLRLFRAYAAVLTGYTIVIVSSPAFANPDSIFLAAMGRLSAVTTGVVVTAFVFMVTSPRKPSQVLVTLGDVFRETVRHALSFHSAESNRSSPAQAAEAMEDQMPGLENTSSTPTFRGLPQPLYDSRGRLLARMTGLGPAIEYAAADDRDMQARVRRLRIGLSRLTGLIVTYHPYWLNLSLANGASCQVHQEVAETLKTILDLTEQPGWQDNPKPVSDCIHATLEKLDLLERQNPTPTVLASLDNTRDVLVHLDMALHDITTRRPGRRSVKMATYLEWPMAMRNGARGMFIALLAGMLWYVLHWSAGPMLMLYVVAASSLLSTTPSAAKTSPLMAVGTALAIPASFLCHVVGLPRIDGYPLLWMTVCLFLLPGVWLQFHPRYSIGAFGYAVFFTMMLSVTNPIVYDDMTLTNNWMTMAAACVLLVLVFRVILPADHRLDAARLVSSLTRSVQQLAAAPQNRPILWVVWESLQLQKIARLMMRLSFLDESVDRKGYTDAAFAAISLGRLIVRLRWNAGHTVLAPSAHDALLDALKSFRTLHHAPEQTAAELLKTAHHISAIPHPEAACLARERVVSCLEQAAYIITSVPGFFHRYGPLQLSRDIPGANAGVTAVVPHHNPVFG
ncbi:FUSC family protein [Acetobacter senegalensis]|uniref:FUSC family protein n=1 Tax=Acetobacter senegalensis TaxID=446692 RepID=UPI001EDBBF9B|nr:FUSC family protein [Acetobacter senegalensis]MCG4260255.1 FUSC family protein [Acetobacter senegalensis]